MPHVDMADSGSSAGGAGAEKIDIRCYMRMLPFIELMLGLCILHCHEREGEREKIMEKAHTKYSLRESEKKELCRNAPDFMRVLHCYLRDRARTSAHTNFAAQHAGSLEE
jgi:hypothetical protein